LASKNNSLQSILGGYLKKYTIFRGFLIIKNNDFTIFFENSKNLLFKQLKMGWISSGQNLLVASPS
jgi:hypothetical protein